MWSVGHTAVNEPLDDAVSWVVLAHCQFVSRPLRWISTVSPAAPDPIVPVNLVGCRRMAEASVRTVIPFPLALTGTLACWTCPEAVELLEPLLPEPPSPAPPEAAYTRPGTASAAPITASRATTCAFTRRLTVGIGPFTVCLRGELTGSRWCGATVLYRTDSPLRLCGPQ